MKDYPEPKPSETLEGVAADRLLRDRRRERTQRSDPTPARSIGELFTGQRTEDPKVIRRAKARDAFYGRLTGLIALAMILTAIYFTIRLFVK